MGAAHPLNAEQPHNQTNQYGHHTPTVLPRPELRRRDAGSCHNRKPLNPNLCQPQMIDEEEIYPVSQPAPWACSLCGGTSWPEKHTECPLCRADEETEDEE